MGRGLLLLLGKGGSRDVTAHTAGCTLSWTERCGRCLGWELPGSVYHSGSWDLSGAKGWVQGTEVSLSVMVLKFGCMESLKGLLKQITGPHAQHFRFRWSGVEPENLSPSTWGTQVLLTQPAQGWDFENRWLGSVGPG